MSHRRVLSLLRDSLHYRAYAFPCGLRLHGFKRVDELDRPGPNDLLLIWNRGGGRSLAAQRFEAAGARVVVAENGYLGKTWRDDKWFALALGHHCGAGIWPDGGGERWDALGVELAPWRTDGTQTLVLEQRGIGEPGIASPNGWADTVAPAVRGRIRRHPGAWPVSITLEADLRNVREVVTWASGAALLALTMGVPVFHAFPRWIGAAAARPLADFGKPALRDDAARLAMFRRLAWAQWTLAEVASGEAFDHLLQLHA
jgi:hypothetical protein